MSSDAELIGRSLRGDTDAFVEVVSRHETALGNYLARRVGRQAAEDVLGDVWVAAYESRAKYDRSYPEARPWLYGVALNRLRRHWRSPPAGGPGAGPTGGGGGGGPRPGGGGPRATPALPSRGPG